MHRLREHIEAIVELTDEEFARIQSFFTLRRFKKHQYPVQEGDPAKYEYLVLSGIFRMFYLDDNGKEHIVQFAGTDWWMANYRETPHYREFVAGRILPLLADRQVLLTHEAAL